MRLVKMVVKTLLSKFGGYSASQLLNLVIPLLPALIPIVVEMITFISQHTDEIKLTIKAVKALKTSV